MFACSPIIKVFQVYLRALCGILTFLTLHSQLPKHVSPTVKLYADDAICRVINTPNSISIIIFLLDLHHYELTIDKCLLMPPNVHIYNYHSLAIPFSI